jgi:integrase/recombinase XerD
MNPDSLRSLVDQYLALNRPTERIHPDDAVRHRGKLRYHKKLLRNFIQFWSARGQPWPIPPALALEWVSQGSDLQHPYRDRQRIFGLRGFLKFLRGTEPATQLPDNIFRRLPRRALHVLSEQEIVQLMEAPQQLRLCQAFHGLTWSTLLGLLASAGLRIGEAIRLKVGEAHLETDPPHLAIYETKFGKSRIVVLHPSVADRLRAYAQQRTKVLGNRPAEAFFTRHTGKSLRYNTARSTFSRLLHHARIATAPGESKITLHSLRHSFAVRRLTLWHRAGRNVAELLPHLAVYLGHLAPADTYWYLTATAELLESASVRFENHQREGASQ